MTNYNIKMFNLINFIKNKEDNMPKTIGYHYNKRCLLNNYLKIISEKLFNGYKFDKKEYKKFVSIIETVYLLHIDIC